MQVYETSIGRIVKYSYKEKERISEARYEICSVDPEEPIQSQLLIDEGFRFLDREIVMEIQLSKVSAPSSGSFEIEVYKAEIGNDIYSLAYDVFLRDRRFHLNTVYDMEMARPVIKSFIDDCVERRMKAYRVHHNDELLGFTILSYNPYGGGLDSFENVLGAAKPGIKGKMAVDYLYRTMLIGERDAYSRYIGRVSSKNVASLNMHYQLGAKSTGIIDYYIRIKE